MSAARLFVVLGGARSGKSRIAEALALELARPGRPCYLATGEAMDAEFRRRIEAHRESRGEMFSTLEEPLQIDVAATQALERDRVCLLECLTTWLGNVCFRHPTEFESSALTVIDSLLQGLGKNLVKSDPLERLMAADKLPSPPLQKILADRRPALVVVAGQLGQGIIPMEASLRAFQDLHGLITEKLCSSADGVWTVEAGQPRRCR